MTGDAWNIPNSLTLLRILLIPVFVGLMLYGWYDPALAVLLGAGLTDALDGTIARAANQRTKLGMYLDPLADKLLLTSGFLTLSALHLVPLWMVILVVSRDVILLAGAVLAHLTDSAVDIAPTLLGKGTTVFQLTYLLLAVVFVSRQMDMHLLDPLLYSAVLLTVASGFHYLYRGFARLNVGQ
ncbi:MAG: CDP-alcohol phosphatidyltransferase family protein, partial [Nitrospiraceae bacterium]|nr:CDP-alcohol phosphatidyltransferase family protein [Nitrospiraceae bacterium]